MNITLDDGRTELWQWDTGRKIVVDDKSVSEVHYSKYSSTQAITREVINGKAEIPNFLLQDTHAVTAYAYSGSIENGYTMAEKTFNVVKKPKPANYVETEEDKAILAKLKAAIGDLSELQTEAKDNLVSAINEAAASGGADWAQNDPDGDGYVANRPGGYMTDPVITDVGTFTITSAEDIGGLYMAEVAVESSAITLSDYVIGDGVIVDFGGQSYSLTWQLMEGFPSCGAAVTGEALDWSAAPFCIIAVFGGDGGLRGYYVYLQNAVTSPIQVKLTMSKQTPVKIPKKYLDTDLLDTYVFTVDTDRLTSTASLQDIQNAIDAHKIPVAMFNGLYPATISSRWSDIDGYEFEAIVDNRISSISCSNGGWDHFSRTEILTEESFSSSLPEPIGIAAAGIRSTPARSDHVHQTELPIVADVETEDCLVLYVERTTNRPSDTDLLTLEGSYYYYSEKSWTGFYTKVTPQYGDPLQVLNNKHPSDFKINARLETQSTTLSSWDNSRLAYAESVNEGSGSFGLIIKAVSRDDKYHFAMPMIYVSEADAGKENVDFSTRYSSASDHQSVTIKKLPDNSGLYLLYELDNLIYSEKGETKAVAITAPDTAPKKFFVFSPWKSTDVLPSSPSFETVIRKEVYPSGGASDFVINATLDGNKNCAVDKTYAQIQEAVQAGKNAVMHLATTEGTNILPLALDLGGAFAFAAIFSINSGEFIQYTVSVSNSNAVFISTHGIGLDDTGMFPQVEMSSDPASAMEIATKKYVDDKEFILQSTTPNSTKKFKITVDDTGALSAVEVTT